MRLIPDPVVVRPGFIGPHSATGDSAAGDFLTRFIRTILQTGQYPDGRRQFEFTPVEEMARQIWDAAPESAKPLPSASSAPHAPSRWNRTIYHLMGDLDSPDQLSFDDIGQQVVVASTPFLVTPPQRVSASEFVASIERDTESPLYPLLPVIEADHYFGPRSISSASVSSKAKGLISVQARAVRECATRILTAMELKQG